MNMHPRQQEQGRAIHADVRGAEARSPAAEAAPYGTEPLELGSYPRERRGNCADRTEPAA